MKEHTNAQPAFHGTTVVSTRKESAIEGAIVRRRVGSDGKRFTTYEIDESKAELLLAMPGGLVRRHTAINPDNVTRAVELAKSGKSRKEAEQELGVSSGTFRRLLEAGGVATRTYTPVLTEDNVVKALKVSVKYDIRKRGDIIRASKEVGVDSRTLRRLLARGLEVFTLDQIGAIRSAESARLATEDGQKEMEMSKQPIPRKPKVAKAAKVKPAPTVPVDANTPPPVRDAAERGDDHSAETGLVASPLVPVTPHDVEVRTKDGQPTVIEQQPLIDQPGTSLHEPHGDGAHRTARDAAAADLAASPVVPADLKPLEMVPPVQPVDALDRTRPNVVSGGTTVEPIEAVSDVDEQKAKGIFAPTRDGAAVEVDPAISLGSPDQFNADQEKSQQRTDAVNVDQSSVHLQHPRGDVNVEADKAKDAERK